MVNPVRVIVLSMVGACAGMAAGVILVGLWGAFAGIPYILNHPGPNNNPVIAIRTRGGRNMAI